jgi:LEA14-like dessication related protein
MENKTTILKVGIAAGIIGLVVGIYSLYRRQLYLAMQYCYKLYKVVPKKFTKESIEMDVILKILNRSNFDLTVKSYAIDIYINDVFVTTVSSSVESLLVANGVSLFTANVKIDPAKVFKPLYLINLISSYITDKSKITIRAIGILSVKADFITIKQLPINYADTLKALLTVDPKTESEKLVCPKDF